ncbi:trypsin-like serine protease [Thiorhodococcus fuscus]|uniref:Trypsin-like serine protease n=1 Tax=Thiorhodococcus fuscus TaxID=527200 RepID=A0ABW4Y9C9_9GAMM
MKRDPFLRILAILLPLWSSSAVALLGGQLDTQGRYGAVVSLGEGERLHCSATKIGPDRFLTAAHCVVSLGDGELEDAFRPGRRLFIGHQLAPRSPDDLTPVTLAEVRLHPSYAQALRRFIAYRQETIRAYRERYSGDELARRVRLVKLDTHFTSRFPDVAILTVAEPTPDIPVLSVDCEPLRAGETVEIVGYGYESLKTMALARRTMPYGRRNVGSSQVIRVDPVNFYTYAGEMRSGRPSLSPGDSGGPVLRGGQVVGVNGSVYGLNRLDRARSNMSVNLSGLGSDAGFGCRRFFGLPSGPFSATKSSD